jgi:hypothetical protein
MKLGRLCEQGRSDYNRLVRPPHRVGLTGFEGNIITFLQKYSGKSK